MSEEYSVLKKQVFELNDLKLVPIRFIDRYSIMNWRNEQIYHLRQSITLSKEEQDKYFKDVISKDFNEKKPSQILFSYLEGKKCIGYGGFVNINWADRRAEMSFLLDTSLKGDSKKYDYYFSNFINLLKIIGFQEIGLNRIFTETYSFRKNHIKILEDNDFLSEGVMKEHILMIEENKYYDSVLHGSLKKYYEK